MDIDAWLHNHTVPAGWIGLFSAGAAVNEADAGLKILNLQVEINPAQKVNLRKS
jgi:hypothetical protein